MITYNDSMVMACCDDCKRSVTWRPCRDMKISRRDKVLFGSIDTFAACDSMSVSYDDYFELAMHGTRRGYFALLNDNFRCSTYSM